MKKNNVLKLKELLRNRGFLISFFAFGIIFLLITTIMYIFPGSNGSLFGLFILPFWAILTIFVNNKTIVVNAIIPSILIYFFMLTVLATLTTKYVNLKKISILYSLWFIIYWIVSNILLYFIINWIAPIHT